MQYSVAAIAILSVLLSLGSPARLETIDFSEMDPGAQTVHQIKWPKRTIEIAFSASLSSPGPNIKPGSDVIGAARRALSRWSTMANITFVETVSSAVSISQTTGGDGTNLLTIADTTENEALFGVEATTGRTRVFYDPETGVIAEADICINPHPRSADGTALQFSTDGTPDTYDLEATFVHEIGHLLGLDHSDVLASTMQAHQAVNGTYGLPALTERTLSEDDRQRVRSLYGPKQRSGRIEGRLIDNLSGGAGVPLNAVSVWAENIDSGRVIASDITADDGSYRLEGLPTGQYRLLAEPDGNAAPANVIGSLKRFRSFELASQVVVKPDMLKIVNYNLVPPQNSPPALNPRLIGINGELSNATVPLETGKRVKIYIGGDGIDQVPGTSIAITSPFFAVDPSSLAREQFAVPFPVISFDVTVAANAPFGDYSIRLQANSGETAYIPGGLTIDPGAVSQWSNPVDDLKFLIGQHYRDLAGRELDQAGLDYWATQFAPCGSRNDCIRARRIDVSAALFLENELSATNAFVYALYADVLGRRPRFAEFESDRRVVLDQGPDFEAGRRVLALAFVQRSEFQHRYPSAMKAKEFVNSLTSSISQGADTDLSFQRDSPVASYDGTNAGRAALLTRLLASRVFTDVEYNQAFVLMQYFSFLRRDPDDAGYNLWVNVLKSKPTRDREAARSTVCVFLNSAEYQARFGMLATHSSNECGN
jgi:Matrixin/Domain of unknown function (DUF4214)